MVSHRDLLKRHRAIMPDWIALYYDEPIALVRGEGRRVWDAEGNQYLDWFGGILTTSTGYSLPEVVEAVQQQAARMLHTSTLYLIEQQVELAEELARLAPVDDAKVFFCNSGTEANETALMLATKVRCSNQVLAMRNSYHGRSFGAMAITGNRGWRASSLTPFNVTYAEGSYPYRSPYGDLADDDYIAACVADFENLLATTQSIDPVACLIAEPIQGVGGFTSPPDRFFGAIKQVLDRERILFVSDEVQTAWGRAGDGFWGIDAHGVRPDIMTFAKGLGNGLAVGGVIARAELLDSVNAGSISTFGGNPLSMAGALANLRYIVANDLQRNVREVGGRIIGRLREAQASGALPIIGDVRGKGLMFAVELVQPGSQLPGRAGDPDAASAAAALEACRERGLLVGKGGLQGNVLRMAPALTLTVDEADEGVELLLASLADAQKSVHGIDAPVAEGAHA